MTSIAKKSYHKFLLLICLFYASILQSQDGGVLIRNFDLNGEEDVWNTSQSADGFDYIVGSLKRQPNIQGAFIVKSDSCGNIIWSRVITGFGTQIFRRVQATKDSGAIAVGVSSTYPGTTNFSVIAVKWDKFGNKEWAKALQINSQFGNWALAVLPTSDNGFLINGNINSAGYFASSFALKLNSIGEFQWMKKYSFFEGVNQRGAIETNDGYAIAGDYLIEGNTTYHTYVVKLDKNNGNVQLLKSYKFAGIVLTGGPLKKRPGGYLYNGLRMFDVAGTSDWRQVIIYLDEDFNAEKAIEFRNNINRGYCEPDILALPDGGFVGCFGGIRQGDDADIYKVDPTGKIIWKSKIGGIGAQSLSGISKASDQHFIFMGSTQTLNGGKDILWMKVNTNDQPKVCEMVESDIEAFDYPVTSVNFAYEDISNLPASSWVVINPVIESDVHNATFICPNSLIVSNDTSVCANTTFSLNASGLKSYRWYPETGIDDPLSPNPNFNIDRTTTFYVTGNNSTGCSFTDSVLVVVNPSPETSITTSIIGLCSPDSIAIAATGGEKYQWEPAALFESPTKEQSKVWVPSDTIFKVKITNAEGCSKDDSIKVQMGNRPDFKISFSDTTICKGDSIEIFAEGGSIYYWGDLPPVEMNASRIVVAPVKDSIVKVKIVNEVCNDSIELAANIKIKNLPDVALSKSNDVDCDNITSQLNASGAEKYRWVPDAGLNNAAIPNPIVSISASTLYKVYATGSNNCTSVDSIQVDFSDFKKLIVTPDTAVCKFDSVQLSAIGANSFSWYPAGGLSNAAIAQPKAIVEHEIVYYVTGTTANGCIARDSVRLDFLELPVGNISIDRSIVCQIGSVSLKVSGGESYQWYPANLFSNPLSDSTIATIDKPTPLYVEILGNNSCRSVDSVFVNWKPTPIYSANAINERVCLGSTHEVSALGGNRYLWMPSSLFQNPALQNATVKISGDTVVRVQIWNDECRDSTMLEVNLRLWPKPNLTVSKSGDIDCSTPTIELNATGGESYRWSPTIGLSNPNIPNPLASPAESTVYRVDVKDQNSCLYSDSVSINVLNTGGLSLYQLPNAFTPNGDGLNDCFGISKWGNGIIIEKFFVYDRWGNMVFSGNKDNTCWDGTIKGIQAPSGAFAYQLIALSPCGSINLKGLVTLIR